MQRSLKGETAHTVYNVGGDASLDNICKNVTIIYGSVKSFDLLMREFYREDQDKESIPSYVKRIEALLSRIREMLHKQIPFHEEQRALRDRLFHGSRKEC